MVVVVLGGTGSCGTFFVAHALNAGFTVRVLTRRPESVMTERFSWAEHPNLELFQGDLSNAEALREICDGGDVVVSLAGPPAGAKTSVLPEAIRNTVAAMREHGIKRLIVQTGGFVKLKGEKDTLLSRGAREAFALVMKEKATLAGNDEVALFLQEECADIDWTITRPGLLSDEGTQGMVEAANDYGPGMPGGTPSKIDLTRWYIELLTDTRSFKKAPAPQYAAVDYGFAQERVNGQKRVAVITGANSGIGFETARELAGRGAQVHLLCRNDTRGKAALESIKSELPNADIKLWIVDVSSFESIDAFVEAFDVEELDVLINNAGVLPSERHLSPDGFELTLATNYLGGHRLTMGLMPKLERSEEARVIAVSSGGMYTQRASLDDLDWNTRSFDGVVAYAMTKRFQVMMTEMLAQSALGNKVRFECMHPGWADTPAVQSSIPGFHKATKSILRSPREGADTVIYLASAVDLPTPKGLFWFDRKPRDPYLLPRTREGQEIREALWNFSFESLNLPAPQFPGSQH